MPAASPANHTATENSMASVPVSPPGPRRAKFRLRVEDYHQVNRSNDMPTKHILHIRANDLVAQCISEPLSRGETTLFDYTSVNPRNPKKTAGGKLGKSRVIVSIRQGLSEDPDNFDLRHKGITLVAENIRPLGDGLYQVVMTDAEHHGIVDGLHTLHLLHEVARERSFRENGSLDRAMVEVNVITDASDRQLIVDLAEGLNTNLQVDDSDLDNLEGIYDHLKDVVKNSPFAYPVEFRAGEVKGSEKFDVEYVIQLIELFNIHDYPANGDDPKAPSSIHSNRSKTRQNFRDAMAAGNIETRRKRALTDLLPTIIRLADIVCDKVGPYREKQDFNQLYHTREGKTNLNHTWLFVALSPFRLLLDSAYRWRIDPLTIAQDTQVLDVLGEILKKKTAGAINRKDLEKAEVYEILLERFRYALLRLGHDWVIDPKHQSPTEPDNGTIA